MSRRGGLGRDDAVLWAKFVEAIVPLDGRPPVAPISPAAAEAVPAAAGPTARPVPPSPRQPAAPPAAIETRLARRLARGTAAIDGRLDLHGLRQTEAHRRLREFLLAAQAGGDRVVLVITGKGASDADAVPLADRRGVLRRLVPLWLGDPALHGVVVGFGEAGPGHGGAGALYVRIRRRR